MDLKAPLHIPPFWRTYGSRALQLLLAAIVVALVIARPFLYPHPEWVYFDDFYYYLVPAKHYWASGAFDFFPGMHTNGFQPLWMGLITALLGVAGNGALFFLLFNIGIALLLLAAFYQAVALTRELGADGWISLCAGMGVLAVQLNIATSGMEVALAVPLLLWLTRLILRRPLSELTAPQLLGLGFIGSITILARLDAALLLLPVAVAFCLRDRPCARSILIIVLGALPLWAYIALNQLWMGIPIPISGLAKQMKQGLWPNIKPLFDLIRTNGVILLSFAAFPLMALAAVVQREALSRQRLMLLASSAGVVLYYAVYSVISDWLLWAWYSYPMAWLAPMAMAGFARTARGATRAIAELTCPALLIASIWAVVGRMPEEQSLYNTAAAIKSFAREHPGTYAMGDRSGGVGYMLDGKLLQLEGLVGDRTLLNAIQTGTPLHTVLERYKIDYYIVLNPKKRDGCYLAREPAQAGAASPAMRGHICREPLMVDTVNGLTMIFPAAAVQ